MNTRTPIHGCQRYKTSQDLVPWVFSNCVLYNEVRPHSSLGYLTPAAFAVRLATSAPCDATGRDAAVHGASAPGPLLNRSGTNAASEVTCFPVSGDRRLGSLRWGSREVASFTF